ncbi:restriction endonuclease [Schleiferilactobacillus perolens]|jgi:restriction system protein|uniref:Restriction endonuclease type IV Mrr domain-containing protein n=1 Tax=Schleiferilactobacillus perolens DSM 12744 TaxID=1423792 RepID=A0A0R1MXT6_9LACO|nr:restriction endonuclease [Schleiferilactobacillus perolens]KRL12361.1 hypothetical protein FD09_GL002941 [Schleiferilactobacillus perolens DSM 12744]MCI1892802.1 restriction endonuclease [Schleiferilactobacillus harbinensis]MCI1913785.1 restriction endonuclease [Schleiferilactobacillus harbinensis]MCI2170812.1 restriction endonuclease [Schleiferilactobacillus perolens]
MRHKGLLRTGITLTVIIGIILTIYRMGIRPKLALFDAQRYDPYFWGALGLLLAGWLIALIFFLRRFSGGMAKIDRMDGIAFEEFTAQLLVHLGFTEVEVTPASRDQGVDVIAHSDGESYGIQCKRYNHYVDNSAVQEIFTGCAFYHLDHPVVISNNYFSASAKELAHGVGVKLIDRDQLAQMLADRKKY